VGVVTQEGRLVGRGEPRKLFSEAKGGEGTAGGRRSHRERGGEQTRHLVPRGAVFQAVGAMKRDNTKREQKPHTPLGGQ